MHYLLLLIGSACLLTSCTVAFSNVSSNGTAKDVLDENQTTDPDVKATVPLK